MELLSIKTSGFIHNSSFSLNFNVQVFAKNVIDLLTAEAWFSEDKQLKEKVCLQFTSPTASFRICFFILLYLLRRLLN